MPRLLPPPSILLLVLALTAPARAGTPPGRVEVEPANVEVGLFYCGQEVRVTASMADCDGVAIRVSGPEEPLVLNRKGKKYGILWMNVGEVHFKSVPTLYVLRSSRKLDELADTQTLDRLELGLPALEHRAAADAENEGGDLFGEMVRLKEKDRLYSSQASGVEVRSLGAGRQEATAELCLPAKTAVGEYTVDVFSFRKGRGELVGSTTVHLERAPAVSFIRSLAADHGLLYGCLAVGVAVFAGLLTGFIFRK